MSSTTTRSQEQTFATVRATDPSAFALFTVWVRVSRVNHHPQVGLDRRVRERFDEMTLTRPVGYRRFELRSLSFALVMTFLRLMQCGWWRSLGG
ncbi:hypothetical protein AXA44_12260 [Rhodococcus sp. SC4]|nr:hypothetical protein AXA44_12260 [Rhodococcus sp. SC4]